MFDSRNDFIRFGRLRAEKGPKGIPRSLDSYHVSRHLRRCHTFHICCDLWQSQVCSVNWNAIYCRLFYALSQCKYKRQNQIKIPRQNLDIIDYKLTDVLSRVHRVSISRVQNRSWINNEPLRYRESILLYQDICAQSLIFVAIVKRFSSFPDLFLQSTE